MNPHLSVRAQLTGTHRNTASVVSKTALILLLGLATFRARAAVPSAPSVVFDLSHGDTTALSKASANDHAHGETWAGPLSGMATSLERNGFRVNILPPGQPIPPGTNVLILPPPQQEFANGEADAIRAFVEKGGGLLLIGSGSNDGSKIVIFNELLGSFAGVGLAYDGRAPAEPHDANYTKNPKSFILDGPYGRATVGRGLSLPHALTLTITPPAVGHVWQSGKIVDNPAGVTFATSAFKSGHIAAIGDDTPAFNSPHENPEIGFTSRSSDNEVILTNAIAWLSKSSGRPTPASPATKTANPEGTSKPINNENWFLKKLQVWQAARPTLFQAALLLPSFGLLTAVFFFRLRRIHVETNIRGNVIELQVRTQYRGEMRIRWESVSPMIVNLLENNLKTSGTRTGNEFIAPLRRGPQQYELVVDPKDGAREQVPITIEFPSKLRWPRAQAVFETLSVGLTEAADAKTAASSTYVEVPPAPNKDVGPSSEVATSTEGQTVAPWRDAAGTAKPALEELERELLSAVNEFSGRTSVDRGQLRAALQRRGLNVIVGSPTRTPESARHLFRHLWLAPDERAGGWIWGPREDTSRVVLIPFEPREIARDDMYTYLSTLFDGVPDEGFIGRKVPAFSAGVWLTQAADGSYGIIKRGALAASATTTRKTALATPGGDSVNALAAVEQQVAALKELPSQIAELERTVKKVQQELERLSNAQGRISGRTVSEEKSAERTLILQLKQQVENQQNTIDEITRRLGQSPSASASADHRFRTFASGDDRPSPLPPPQKSATLTTAVAENLVADILPTAKRQEIVDLPRGWQKALTSPSGLPNFADPDSYRQALLSTVTALEKLKWRGMEMKVVHLIPEHDPDEVEYTVHFDDSWDATAEGFRCTTNPARLAPARQFFVGVWDEDGNVAVMCPAGRYDPVPFDYTALIDDAPAGTFTITEIREPAQMRRTNGHFSIRRRMIADFG